MSGKPLGARQLRALPASLALLAAPVLSLAGQTMQHAGASRQLLDQTSLHATVTFAAGNLTITPGPAGVLYKMDVDYDGERFTPVSRWEAGTQSVELGLKASGEGGLRVSNREHLAQSAVIQFSREIPLSLDATIGAAEAGLDLGGLRLTSIHLTTAGSRTAVRFGSVNPGRCDSLALEAGAAEVLVQSLGNSRCHSVRVSGGAGGLTLDLTGAWTGETTIAVALAVGQVTLRIPQDLGVSLTLDRFLSSFEPKGFVRVGDSWQTLEYGQSPRRVNIQLTSTVGGVKIEWLP
jgi:hypothetical protein